MSAPHNLGDKVIVTNPIDGEDDYAKGDILTITGDLGYGRTRPAHLYRAETAAGRRVIVWSDEVTPAAYPARAAPGRVYIDGDTYVQVGIDYSELEFRAMAQAAQARATRKNPKLSKAQRKAARTRRDRQRLADAKEFLAQVVDDPGVQDDVRLQAARLLLDWSA